MIDNINLLVSSKEAKSLLKVSDCDLAHIRNSGSLEFTKKGNAYLYSKESLDLYNIKKNKNTNSQKKTN